MKIQRLIERVSKLTDPRRTSHGNICHKLEDIIAIGWSRKAPPYNITEAGLRRPLREPYVPLSRYTALLLLVQKNSIFVNNAPVTASANNQSFTLFGYHSQFPLLLAF